MVDSRVGSSTNTVVGGSVAESGGRRTGTIAVPGVPGRGIPLGRPGNRWPNPKELAALLVDGILRLPARYRRGMFLDILT
jgi:hypothetical protein